MKNNLLKIGVITLMMFSSSQAFSQLNLKRALGGAAKAVEAVTLSDKQMAEYVSEYVEWMDENNPVTPEDNEYTIRLRKLTEGITEVDGIPLNFEVYHVIDVNAFACPDGSIRVFSSLMDIMSDDELMGIIGHEIGHIANRDSKDAYRNALLTSALRDGASSTGGTAEALSDSQLGDLGEALMSATYSKKQEHEADLYGYEFLKKAGRNPWAMHLSFKRLQTMAQENGGSETSKMNQLFSTHPDLENRMERMKEMAIEDGFPMPEQSAE